jgi:hypothetical protein
VLRLALVAYAAVTREASASIPGRSAAVTQTRRPTGVVNDGECRAPTIR